MIFRKIQGSNLRSSIIGYGTWGLSGKVYGKISKKKALNLLKHAYNKKINFFDTANLYGNGYVEKLLGEAFTKKEKQKIIIATKIGMIRNEKNAFIPKFNFDTNFLQKNIFSSIKRLKVDSIDLLQIHSPKKNFLESNKFHEVVDLLKKNKKDGNINYYGISLQNPKEALFILKKNYGFNTIQINFNLLDMRAFDDGIFDLAKKNNVSIITRTPMAMGMLKINKVDFHKKKNDHRKRFNKEKLNKLHLASIQFSKEFNSQISLQALALKFATFDKNISTTVTGMMETKEINSNIRSFQNNFSILKNLKKLKKIYNDFY